jgi:dienelactone hydrolase
VRFASSTNIRVVRVVIQLRRWKLNCLGILSAVTMIVLSASAHADPFLREELRVPMTAAGPQGLEAILVRPNDPGRYPLVLISHGAEPDAKGKLALTPLAYLSQAIEFARRGWAAAVVLRRGYGDSGGVSQERTSCAKPDYAQVGRGMTADIRAAIAFLSSRPDIDGSRVMAVGQSAGGFASLAYAAEAPPGLVATISFAGGVVTFKNNKVCVEDELASVYRDFGHKSKAPTLWIYANNDRRFDPAFVERLHTAFVAGGGSVELVKMPSFGENGHVFFVQPWSARIWTRYVDDFLARHGLALSASPLPALPPNVAVPPQLPASGRIAFSNYLAAAPHKAFAATDRGDYAWYSARRTADDAKALALELCGKHGRACRILAVDDAAAH